MSKKSLARRGRFRCCPGIRDVGIGDRRFVSVRLMSRTLCKLMPKPRRPHAAPQMLIHALVGRTVAIPCHQPSPTTTSTLAYSAAALSVRCTLLGGTPTTEGRLYFTGCIPRKTSANGDRLLQRRLVRVPQRNCDRTKRHAGPQASSLPAATPSRPRLRATQWPTRSKFRQGWPVKRCCATALSIHQARPTTSNCCADEIISRCL